MSSYNYHVYILDPIRSSEDPVTREEAEREARQTPDDRYIGFVHEGDSPLPLAIFYQGKQFVAQDE